MTLQEFIAANDNKKLDWDGSYGAQCVDLYRFYLRDVWGVPQTPKVVGAADIFDTLPSGFIKEKNTPTGVPQIGDVIIWNKKYGTYGHVGVVTKATINQFFCFEQNDPLGSACHTKRYTYKNIIGWFRPVTGDSMNIVKSGSTYYLEGEKGYYGFADNKVLQLFQKLTGKVQERKPVGAQLGVVEAAPQGFLIKEK